MTGRATFARVAVALVLLVLLVLAACGSIDLGSHGGGVDPDGGGPDVFAPPDGPVVGDGGPEAEAAAKDAAIVYLKPSNTQPKEEFADVVLDGDTLVVGAPREQSAASGVNADQTDRSAPSAGAVYVFRRTGGVWAQEAYIKASNAAGGAVFGAAVALHGDTLVVGAFQESTSALHAGAAYVFTRAGTTWSEQAILRASNARAEAAFGNSVALSGNDLVVGAPGDTSNAVGVNGNQGDSSVPGAGAAYTFTRTGSSWSQTAYLKASNTGVNAAFGTTVALENDTLVVGALSEASKATGVNGDQSDTSAAGAGAAYVFARNAGTWSQQAYLKSSNRPPAGAQQGFSLALSLSLNTLAVGQYIEPSGAKGVGGNQNDSSAANAGAVYVFTRTGSTWSQQAYLKASNTRTLALFGYSLALDGDSLVVGSSGESSNAVGRDGNQADTSQSSAGAAYTFARKGSAWSQTHYLKATNTQGQASFGYSVSQSGGTIAVGAVYESSGATGVNGDAGNDAAPLSGAVYVFP